MFQHITPEMLAELSPQAQKRLRDWWETSEGDKFFDSFERWCLCYDGSRDMVVSTGLSKHDKQVCLPLLNIGQCIELLLGYDEQRQVDLFSLCTESLYKGIVWIVDGENRAVRSDELIRALWDAAKAVLEAGDCPEWKEARR